MSDLIFCVSYSVEIILWATLRHEYWVVLSGMPHADQLEFHLLIAKNVQFLTKKMNIFKKKNFDL